MREMILPELAISLIYTGYLKWKYGRSTYKEFKPSPGYAKYKKGHESQLTLEQIQAIIDEVENA